VLQVFWCIFGMSGDTAKENASFVDSSATQKQDAGTLEDPGTNMALVCNFCLFLQAENLLLR